VKYKFITTFIFSFICAINSFAQQITTNNSLPLEQLIQGIFGQNCVDISNISSTVNGSTTGISSFGYFERSNSNFPFQSGIVLTTGNANSAGNVQNNIILNDGDESWITDIDLETALGISNTLNATSIEFDFISISNQIQFNYILASEEYFGNFPCEYSDGFAFLIREAGTSNPYTNIALVPGTSTPVNTNTIHDEIFGFCDASNEGYFEGYNLGDTNYNGRTAVLSAEASIQPNVQYQIKLVIADQTDENYDSAVFLEGNSFNASVDLGEDFSTCASNYILDGIIENPDATYAWYFNDSLVLSATDPVFNAVQSGNYRVEINLSFSSISCIIEDDITIQLNITQSLDPISNFELCDDLGSNGVEIFDLSTKDADALASVPPSDYTISYHYNSLDAQNASNGITNPIENIANPQVIHVRIEDITDGCVAFSTINLVVNSLPEIIDPTPLVICDDQTADGFTAIDLHIKDDEIKNGEANLVVTYHRNTFDAESNTSALLVPYVNNNVNEQLFVSVTNPQTGCNSTTTLDLTVLDNPIINKDLHYISACESGDDINSVFDLTSIIANLLQGTTGVTVTFHETYADALSSTNPIADETNYTSLNLTEQTVFIRVESNTTGCAAITPLEIHSNLLLTATNIEDSSVCDINNDSTEDFYFDTIAADIINAVPDITITFYETEDDRVNEINAIDTSVDYENLSNPQTIYLTLTSPACAEDAEIDLIVEPIIEFEPIISQTVCDEDQDGITITDLSQFNALVSEGQTGFRIRYFISQEDADSNRNKLPNFYTNTSNPFTVYTRTRPNGSSCAHVNSFEISVIDAPITSSPTAIIICDADRDGFFGIDLTNSISEVVTSTINRTITFHNSLEDADLGENAIIAVSNYAAQTEIVFIRIENNGTYCHTVEELNIIVNTLPYVGDLTHHIDDYTICEDESDSIGEFMFETKDVEALDGQTGKEVTYYLNESDANNKVNTIDKTSIYENISNPQDIFVRIDNITDESCYFTSSFTIEVGTNPFFNEPRSWYVCNDFSNDGSEIFDFSTKVTEISNGIPDIQNVTFHASEIDARNSINPLPLQYANTVNPQEIFVQIDNGTSCNSITSFVLNVIQVPDVNVVAPIVQCYDEDDGILTFDITQAELNILDIRQNQIAIRYYENFEDSELQVNPITNPENYTNTSNPQTVYMEVTNTVSSCYTKFPIELIVNSPPLINDFITYNICANEANTIELTEINQVVTDVNFNVEFSYFSNEADAIFKTNALDTNYTYITNNDTLFVRAEYSSTHCFDYYEFNLNVNPLPIANQPDHLVACDDNSDGLLEFDLLQQNSSVLTSQNPNLFTITYHNSELQANENNSALETDYIAFDSEIIYVRIENSNSGCYSITQFSVFINTLPVVDIEDQVICLDNLPLLVSANTNIPSDQYLWSTNESTPEIEITEIGTYAVTVMSEFGCITTRTFNITESESATIELIETVDFSDPNNITITVSGLGNYLYKLDDNEPQESNIFENVTMGYHTVTLVDLNGCANVTIEVLVVDIPKFFTPNNDGAFDTWHIIGIETLPGTIINVFDRYGKLLTQLSSNSPGWDGTFNGTKMPTNDYWFVAEVQRGLIPFQVKGHFTLKQ
jgi:gliding motility-associated-like protein